MSDRDPGLHNITRPEYAEIDIKTRRHAKLKGGLTRFELICVSVIGLAATAFFLGVAWRALT